MRSPFYRTSVFASLVAYSLNSAAAAPSVLQRGYDADVSGANLAEVALTTSTVGPNTFGQLFTLALDAQPYAQPLYVPNVTIPGLGTHNVLYVATMNDTVYAFDADSSGPALWSVNLASLFSTTALPWGEFNLPPNAPPMTNLGILSTPVIDPSTNVMYVVACTLENGTVAYRLHALDITTGDEPYGPGVLINATYAGVTFQPRYLTQRVSLALANKQVIFGFGAMEQEYAGNYSGWILAYDELTLQQTGAFATTTTTSGSGVWQSGRPPAIDAAGNAYLFTGNAYGNGYDGINNFSESVLEFETSHGLELYNWFTPANWSYLDAHDLDLTSSGPMLIADTPLLAGGGKDGNLYVLNTTNLGQYNASNSQVVQQLSISASEIHGGPVMWNRSPANGGPMLYDWASGDVLKAFPFNGTTFATTPSAAGPTSAVLPGGMLAVSANADAPGSGLLWATTNNPNPLQGILHVYDANNVANELWNSMMTPSRDDFGNFAKFVPPVIANGKVYIASFADKIAVYGLGVTPPAFTVSPLNISFGNVQTTTGSAPQLITVTNTSASAIPIVSIKFLGANVSQFGQTNNCGNSIAAGSSCTVSVVYSPTAAGPQAVWLIVNGGTSFGSKATAISGTGVAPFTLTPPTLTFPGTAPNTLSAPQMATLTNTGVAALPIAGISFTGTNASQFEQTNNCGESVVVGSTCTINVVFAPTFSGGPTAYLSVNGGPGVIDTVKVSGSGDEPFSVSPAIVNFDSVAINASSASQTVTITNTGTASMPFISITITGANAAQFTQTNNCGASLSGGSSCTVSIVFAPVATGLQTASLAIHVPGVSHASTLEGTGTAGAVPFTVAPASLSFGAVAVNSVGTAQAVTVTNTGTSPLPITGIGLTGSKANQFLQTNNCGTSVSVGSSCTVSVSFAPTSAEKPNASVTVSGGPGTTDNVAVTGTGFEPFTVSPTSLDFGTVPVNTSSAALAVTLTNTGSAALPITGISFSGAGGSAYSQTNNCGPSVSVGSGCTINLTFTPATKGKQNGKMTVTSTGIVNSAQLSGTGQ
jgi:hypothetical protein